MISYTIKLKYDDMCGAFSEVANLAADDEVRVRSIMEWINVQRKELTLTKSSCRTPPNHTISHGSESRVHSDVNVLDPISSKRKGSPRKLRRRGPLESSSKRRNVCFMFAY